MSAGWSRGLIIGAGAIAAAVWLRGGPLPPGLFESSENESTVIVDRSGEILYEARGDDGARSVRLSADRPPPALVNATLAAEDHRFWRHPGVDPIAVARAVVHDIRRRGAAEGGSTITQQVAKLLLARRDGATSSRGLIAKLREA